MAHINQDQAVRERLSSHRDQVQQILDRLDAGMECGDLLAEVAAGYRTVGALCADLAVEHLREHLIEVGDADERARGAVDIERLIRGLLD